MSPTRVFSYLSLIWTVLGHWQTKDLGNELDRLSDRQNTQQKQWLKTIIINSNSSSSDRTKTLDLSNISNKKRCLSLSLSHFAMQRVEQRETPKLMERQSKFKFSSICKAFGNEKPTTRRRKTSQKSSSRQTGRQRDGDMLLLGAGAGAGAAIIDDTFDI